MKRRKFLIMVATVFLCLSVVGARAMWEGRGALERGDDAHLNGDQSNAIRWWRRSARWYVPLAPHVGVSYQRLMAMGRTAQDKGDIQTALAAWTGVRSSLRATRSFYSPYSEHADEADTQIAVLMAAWEGAEQSDVDLDEREAWHYSLLKLDQTPSVFWSLIALLGLAIWVGGGFVFALRAVDDKDRLVPRAAAYSAAGIAIGLVTWLAGLHLA